MAGAARFAAPEKFFGCRTLVVFKGAGSFSCAVISKSCWSGRKPRTLHKKREGCGTQINFPPKSTP
jgi:hypothetical protein